MAHRASSAVGDNTTAPVSAACEGCSIHNAANLKKLGIDMERWDYVVALAGNPNTGKSTIFNALTGLRQHTGNWPGKTVNRAEGGFGYNDKQYKVVDLPGTYSLLATSMDEQIARDFILFGQPDVTLVILDATRLERNLNLGLQVLEITDRAVVVVNLMDEARRKAIEIDERALARDLGVPVVAMSARYKQGMDLLLQRISEVADGRVAEHRNRHSTLPADMQQAVKQLTGEIESLYPGLPNARWVALRLLDGDESIVQAVREGVLGDLNRYADNTVNFEAQV